LLLPAFLPDTLGETGRSDAPPARLPALEAYVRERLGADTRDLYTEAHRLVDRVLLPLVMEHPRGNQSQAANVLGVAGQTLRQRLREAGLAEQSAGDAAEDERV